MNSTLNFLPSYSYVFNVVESPRNNLVPLTTYVIEAITSPPCGGNLTDSYKELTSETSSTTVSLHYLQLHKTTS